MTFTLEAPAHPVGGLSGLDGHAIAKAMNVPMDKTRLD
jgi:hypothetical protein